MLDVSGLDLQAGSRMDSRVPPILHLEPVSSSASRKHPAGHSLLFPIPFRNNLFIINILSSPSAQLRNPYESESR
jgi:hypothetical protein